MATVVHDSDRLSEVRLLPVSELKPDSSLRENGIDSQHVAVLCELEGQWSPVLVHGPSNLVVDGAHRVAAARRLGLTTIPAQIFDGPMNNAFVESVRRNSRHGLPLTVNDRMRAARRIVSLFPEWSDRRIAKVCALSSTTVGKVRREASTVDATHTSTRVGIDGRRRPVQPGATRQRVLEALERNPTGSLRSIAAEACASPETVRTIRNSLQADGAALGPNPRMLLDSHLGHLGGPLGASAPEPEVLKAIQDDSALSSCTNHEGLMTWLESASEVERWPLFVDVIPRGRVYELADQARRLSEQWALFARALESRAKPNVAAV
jgi:ParB-like chromosome segregation protein Spo0J